MAEVESFDKTKLKKTETKEKNPLPTKEGVHLQLAHTIGIYRICRTKNTKKYATKFLYYNY